MRYEGDPCRGEGRVGVDGVVTRQCATNARTQVQTRLHFAGGTLGLHAGRG